MLGDVVAILVDNERGSTGVQFLKYRSPGRLFAVFEHPLDNSTTIWMCGQTLHLSDEGIDDKLYVLGWHPLDSFLYDVVTVLVFDASQNMLFELLYQRGLLVGKDVLQCLRKSAINGLESG